GWLFAAGHPPTATLSAIALLFLVGVWACAVTGRHLGVADHGAMVWDEFVAFLLVLAVVPRELGWQAGAFVLFRLFDIAKPPPIRWIERRFHGGFGVMIDDLLAAGYALLCLSLFKRAFL
ncbi:MAG TPA: phosphatidylglycerophosphatase A, partial [Burkholderiales bacterium]|nr:phosphatidylglycerophosphatase A [Burkholderiales bacterium]